jgi:preprotein translocase subunit SecA
MSRAAIAAWGAAPGPDWLRPERAAPAAGPLDRWLAALLVLLAKPLNGIERRRLRRFAERVREAGEGLGSLDLPALAAHAGELRVALHRQGISPALAARAFALAAEASARLLGKRPYAVQLQGGYGLLEGRLIEMATGEGKTLTALLPALTLALAGVPVHVVTVNDYLARRDADYLRPVFELFGFSVGVVTHVEDDAARRIAYQADVTYCVNKDLVFDYLRDSLYAGAAAPSERKQRGLYFALVDEADGILVDEARTPLVIARERAPDSERADAELALRLARALDRGHYRTEQEGRQYRLNAEGRFFLKAQAVSMAPAAANWHIARIREERVEQALCALHAFHRGAHYVVLDDKVQIVDEFTGRILPDRSWERGLHQMIEVKEGLEVTAPRETIARQTYPQFFARYLRIAGMTGTAREVAREIKVNFGMKMVAIPLNRPGIRRFLGVRLLGHSAQRWQLIAERAAALAAEGRAVLVGTRSVLASEELSAVLTRLGQAHQVLNALQDQHEAAIVALAGQPGRVTVATNMAGRGTDIDLAPEVRSAGGLHVILSEFHESRRIDRQLYGRAARQGDPGSCEAIVSLDDELFCRFSPLLVRWLRRRCPPGGELAARWGLLLQFISQQRAERRNAGVRRDSAQRDTAMRRAMAFSGSKT